MDKGNRVVACLVIIKTGTMHMAIAIRETPVIVPASQAGRCVARGNAGTATQSRSSVNKDQDTLIVIKAIRVYKENNGTILLEECRNMSASCVNSL